MNNYQKRKFLLKSYIVRRYILGQKFGSDDKDYVDDGYSSLKKEHDFNNELPDEIYELSKEDLIDIIKEAHNEREWEYEYRDKKEEI